LQQNICSITIGLEAPMNYHLHRDGENLGIFPLEELRSWRQTGRLNGKELVWCAGMSDWQTLDTVLRQNAPGLASAPRPLSPGPAAKSGAPVALIVAVVVACVLFLLIAAAVGVFAVKFVMHHQSTLRHARQRDSESAVALAGKPVAGSTNTVTAAEVQKRGGEFRIRQYLAGYQLRGERNPSCDAEALGMIGNWIACNYNGTVDTNLPPLAEMSDRLATNPACTDPLVLTVAAVNTVELHEMIRRLERAISGFEHSRHKAYPKFYATVLLTDKIFADRADRIPVLDALALHRLKEAFADGSIRPEDQAEIADILIMGWGEDFFSRNATAIYPLVRDQGDSFQWLALVLEGEYQIKEAWKARGGGYSNTVTEKGWEGFREHLAEARECLTRAWKLQPQLPLAPCRMIYVSLGDSGLAEMRTWFDRTLAAQIDYPRAWSDLRWGLRPRWYGDQDSMLALGVTAVHTRRFDTDVPRVFFDVVSDLEAELELPHGQHIYGREDIWPHLQEMYEGYIAAPSQAASRDGWRRTYSVVAYLAGKYDVARKQLEATNWQMKDWNRSGWSTDLSLMPLEVAARTGPLAGQIEEAEGRRNRGDVAAAWRLYSGLKAATNADERTRAFIRDRLVTLELGKRLQAGEWVDFMPPDTNFTGWCVMRGKCKRLPNGALEVRSDATGHMLYSRVPMGKDFEVKGQFEAVSSSTRAFQGGLVLGIPEPESWGWNAFRIKRNDDEGDIACFAQGWSKNQIYGTAKLTATNSFLFRFQAGKVSASVNGQDVFKEVKPRENWYFSTNEVHLGLGAYNDMNDTVIRYSHIQVHQLPAN
jgi:hypothetical protein